MKRICCRATLGLLILALGPLGAMAQARRGRPAPPRIDVEHYELKAELDPAAHELKAAAAMRLRLLEATDLIVLQLSENLSVSKVLNPEGIELEFGQDEFGPGELTVRFPRMLEAGSSVSLTVEYRGGFDRDRYSRNYTRDESSSYIGDDGSYLLYQSKWFPLNDFFSDYATAEIEITVPLGITVIGPGEQLPVVTRGITESFGWSARRAILPNSIVAGRYFEKSVTHGEIEVACFVRQEHLEAIQAHAETLAKILEFYRSRFGPTAAGGRFRLVEVDDRLAQQHGSLGTIFITRSEISQPNPPARELARRAAYQWWQETAGRRSANNLWLAEGLSYLSAALYLGQAGGPAALKEELDQLAVLGLKFESKSAISEGLGLGYRTEAFESVVAGKGAWVLNMLRQLLGDKPFAELLQEYLKEAGPQGRSVDFQALAERKYGKELRWFFGQWVDSTGVPTFDADYVIYKTRDGFRVSGSIRQDRDLFRMPLEVEIETRDGTERGTFELSGLATPFDIETFAMPKRVILDPDNRILRDSKALQTSVQLSLGNDLKKKQNFIEAIRAYEKALEINPLKSLAHFRLAEVFFEQFNYQAAANSFRDALNGDKDPAWIEVWCYIYLGKIYDILGQRQRAMAEYTKAINTKDETDGAQEEAKKYLEEPFTRARTTMDTEPPIPPEPPR